MASKLVMDPYPPPASGNGILPLACQSQSTKDNFFCMAMSAKEGKSLNLYKISHNNLGQITGGL